MSVEAIVAISLGHAFLMLLAAWIMYDEVWGKGHAIGWVEAGAFFVPELFIAFYLVVGLLAGMWYGPRWLAQAIGRALRAFLDENARRRARETADQLPKARAEERK